MSLLNYSTTIQAAKTVGEIERCLVKHGAREILKNYDDNGQIVALSFIAKTSKREIPFRLPINAEAVLKVLYRQSIPTRYKDKPQAIRVAWRIVKDWVEAQMAILETEMVKMEQVFLPYIVTDSGDTLFEVIEKRQFLLTSGEIK